MNRESQTRPSPRQKLGKQGETHAADYLTQQGYRICERNYRADRKEIDLIAEDGQTLVFVGVKTRRSTAFGAPQSAVNQHKQQQMSRAALRYLQTHQLLDHPCRFDVIAILWKNSGIEIEHIQNAFGLVGDYRY